MDEEIVEEDAVAEELDEIALNSYETATKRRQMLMNSKPTSSV
jgi:hypothetical protein